jgi:hypothetical protein
LCNRFGLYASVDTRHRGALSLSFTSPELRATTLPNVILLAWHGAPTAPTIERIGAQMRAHHDAHPEGVVIVNVILGGAPDDAARRALQELGQATMGSVAGVVLALPGGGLKVAIARAAVASLRLVLRPAFPFVVAESLADAASRVRAALLGRRLPAQPEAELRESLEAISRRHAS